MGKLSKVELTKVHYYDVDKIQGNEEISTISKYISRRDNCHSSSTFRHPPIIKKNIFGHRWVLKINDHHPRDKRKKKCNVRVVSYLAVFSSILIAVGFGAYFTIESLMMGSRGTMEEPRIYVNKWNHSSSTILSKPTNGSNETFTHNTRASKVNSSTIIFVKPGSDHLSKYEKLNKTTMIQICSRCMQLEVCLKDGSTISCVSPKDPKDPTGCGGLCKINTQHCKALDRPNKLFECQENRNILKCPHKDDFNCGNMCVRKRRRCDGLINCANKRDEMNCPCNLKTHFHCGNSTSCIENTKRCDGSVDCWDKSDELGCQIACQKDEMTCKNGQCVKSEEFCDGHPHCADNSDEPAGC